MGSTSPGKQGRGRREKGGEGGEEGSDGGRSQVAHSRAAETSQASTVVGATVGGGSGEAADGLCSHVGRTAGSLLADFFQSPVSALQVGPTGC